MHTLVFWIVFLAAVGFAAYRFHRLLRPLFAAPAAGRWDRVPERLLGLATNIGLHRRLLKIHYSGTLHLLIFTGFVALFTAIIQAFGSGLFPGFSLAPVGGNTWIALLQEIFAVVIFVGLGMAVYHRFIIRPARFEGSNRGDATLIYVLVAAVVVSMLLELSFRIAAGDEPSAPWRPLSSAIAAGLEGLGFEGEAAAAGAQVFYWIHVLTILGFLIYLPGSKHRHMFIAFPNIFFRNIGPKGVLPAADLDKPPLGVQRIGQLSWKHMLDLFSCTECGRCQAACPANAAGQALSPKLLIMDLRDHLTETGGTDEQAPAHLAGSVISEETLWACTTCRACMEVCPLHIEHVPKIVELRRDLVEESRVEPMLQDALGNFQQYANSFGKAPRQRARWTKGLDFKVKDARKEPVDILWFVGDFASFDPRVQELSRKVARLLHHAGVDFGILYEAEQNSGNDVRRVGEEGLFQMLAQQNIETIGACTFNRIMTTDPHSLNALRQEYRAFGAVYEVVHYTQLIVELLRAGKIKARPGNGETVTYHDPCYLGRYNGAYDAPREIITTLGYRLHEMARCRENSFCCGAGGGRIWMDDSTMTERPSENRIKEALALGDADTFVVACPKDNVMYSAAAQALGAGERIAVRDIIDLIEVEEAAVAEPADA
jgi:Fe-S oxidoreductase